MEANADLPHQRTNEPPNPAMDYWDDRSLVDPKRAANNELWDYMADSAKQASRDYADCVNDNAVAASAICTQEMPNPAGPDAPPLRMGPKGPEAKSQKQCEDDYQLGMSELHEGVTLGETGVMTTSVSGSVGQTVGEGVPTAGSMASLSVGFKDDDVKTAAFTKTRDHITSERSRGYEAECDDAVNAAKTARLAEYRASHRGSETP